MLIAHQSVADKRFKEPPHGVVIEIPVLENRKGSNLSTLKVVGRVPFR
jgi:hypothetical protein